MKLTALLFLVTLLQVSATTLAQKVTLNETNTPLVEVFDKISVQTGIDFLFTKSMMKNSTPVTIHSQNEELSTVLNKIFRGRPLNYIIKDKAIVVSEKNNSGKLINKTIQSPTLVAIAQKITGVVTDDKGESLPGVNIIEKGTTNGTTTDISGNYSITVNGPNSTLIFSFVGLDPQEIIVNSQTTINVKLASKASDLNEVVVVGYGTSKRSDLTGATATVATKDMKNQPTSRLDEALQGRSPGVVVQNSSADPNGSVNIRIRGSNSINGSNDPLIVIDGFIGGDLTSLNPNDVAGIEVLKDASATAIYGSRGANGVILVTTKKGTPGKPTVQYNDYFNFQSLRKKLDLLNAAQYAGLVNANRVAYGRPKVFSDAQIANFQTNGGTDWQDQVFQHALQQSHQVSISGGGENSSYYVSANAINNEGIVKGSSFKAYAVRSNINSKINDHFDAGLNISLYKSIDHPTTTSRDPNPVNAAVEWAPTLPVYNPDGTYSQPSNQFGQSAIYNPYALAVEPIYDNLSDKINLNTFLNYNIAKGLTAKILFGVNSLDQQNSSYVNTKPAGGLGLAVASINNSRDLILQNTNQINYQNTFAGVHSINLTAVYEQQSETFNTASEGSSGYSSDAVTYNNLALGSQPQIPGSSKNKKVIQSYLGRLNYTFKSKYFLSMSARYDGASVFGENHKWGFFPSGALAWRVDQEEFMKHVDWISNLKLRTSYGVTGSQAIGAYSSLSQLNTNQPYSSIDGTSLTTGVGLGTIANPDLQWEKTGQFNAGFDLGLLNNRIQLSADYYNKITSNLLLSVPTPLTSGYQSKIQNVGKVGNKGYEFSLGGDPVVGKLRWNTNLSLAINQNKILELTPGITSIGFDRTVMTDLLPGFGNTIFLIVGQPMGIIKGYIQNGTWGKGEAAQAATYGVIPGAPKYVDQNHDGKITDADMAIMGSTLPKFTYGWSNTVSYRNFDLNVLMQGVYGNKIYNISRVRTEIDNSGQDATDVRALNYWTPTNQNTNIPSLQGAAYEQSQSSRWIEDGSYLRFKNITLGYTLPKAVLSRIKIKSLRVYFSAVNLLTITKYSDYDPEARSAAGSNVDRFGGINIASYPSQKGYTLGLNLIF